MSGSSLFRLIFRRSRARKPFCVESCSGTSVGAAKEGEESPTVCFSNDVIVFSPICGAFIINEGESFLISVGSSSFLASAFLDVLNK